MLRSRSMSCIVRHVPTGKFFLSALVMMFAASMLAACGGGGGTSSSSSTPSTTISGSVFAAPVSGAGITVKDAGGVFVAGPVTTAADGSYSIVVPGSALSGVLRFESAGGSFTDEASGATAAGGRLSAYVEAGTLVAGSAVHLTPFSTVVHDLVVGGKSVADAKAAFNAAFGFTDNTSVAPKNDNVVTGADNVARRLVALRAVAISQLTRDLGFSPDNQFQLIAAIAQDLSDNTLNGMIGSSPVNVSPGNPLPEDIKNRFECSVDKVYDNTSLNRTGLTADLIGTLPFSKIALTASYRVEYIPGSMPAVQGKTQFRIKITRRSDNTAVTGLVGSGSLNLVPWMHMATKSHSSPWDNAIIDNQDGTYSCNVYYLMSTSMNGIPMGYWRLWVVIGNPGSSEIAKFFPTVGMAMGTNTVRALLKGQLDTIAAIEQRTYYLFKDGGMTYDNTSGTHALNLFLAAKESMTSFPAISIGTILQDTGGTPWPVTTMSVEASTDNVTWLPGTNSAGGHWSVPGLGGLTTGTAGQLVVRLFVNTEQKTTDGLTPAGANRSATFTVTP
jgi:hypothetical protein